MNPPNVWLSFLINFFLACLEGVEHEHADGHGAYTTGNRGDGGAVWCYGGEVYVALQAEACTAYGVGYAGGADVDDGGSGLDHVGGDGCGASHGSDEDVGLPTFGSYVTAVAVEDGDGGVAVLLLHHELGHGLADDVAAAEDDDFLATGGDMVALQEGEDAEGGGADEGWQADGHAAYVDGVEAVDVLAVVYGFGHLLLADVWWQRELDDEAVDGGVVVEATDDGKELLLGDVVLVAEEGALEAAFLACEDFVADVGLAAAVVAYEDGGEVGTLAASGDNLVYCLLDLCLDGRGRGFAVYKCHEYSGFWGVSGVP